MTVGSSCITSFWFFSNNLNWNRPKDEKRDCGENGTVHHRKLVYSWVQLKISCLTFISVHFFCISHIEFWATGKTSNFHLDLLARYFINYVRFLYAKRSEQTQKCKNISGEMQLLLSVWTLYGNSSISSSSRRIYRIHKKKCRVEKV